MQKTIKKYIVVVMLLFAVSATPLITHANYTNGVVGSAQTKDITATITTDKQSYEEGENILFSLIVENGSEYDISSATITYDISNGLSVSDSSAKKKKIAKISSGKEKEIKGTISASKKGAGIPWAPDLMTVLVAGVIVLFLLTVAMIVYYLFARGHMRRHRRHSVFLLAILFGGMLLHTMPVEAQSSEVVVSPVVVVPYGEEEVVIRIDISMELQP